MPGHSQLTQQEVSTWPPERPLQAEASPARLACAVGPPAGSG